jgi:hypothetical protein
LTLPSPGKVNYFAKVLRITLSAKYRIYFRSELVVNVTLPEMEPRCRQRLAAGVLLLVVQFQWIAVDATAETCDLPGLRDSSKSQLPGGWRLDNSTASRLVAETAIANLKSSGSNPKQLVKQHRIIEAFSQVKILRHILFTNPCS